MSTQITTHTKNKTFALPKKGVGVVEKMKNKSWGARLAIILPVFFVVLFAVGIFLPSSEARAEMSLWAKIPLVFALGSGFAPMLISKNSVLEKLVEKGLGKLFEGIAIVFLYIANWLFGCATTVLDLAIKYSLSSHIFDTEAIKTGFNTVLGVANLFFIFILLYIAIATILQLSNFNWKETIAKLVVAVLLINFSLFFTRIIIDASNMFAVNFYNSMKYTGEGGETVYGPSAIVGSSFQFKDAFDPPEAGETLPINGEKLEITPFSRGMVFVGGAIFMVVASFVFLAGAIIFIKRTITFIFLMMLSPIAFIGMILPRTQQYATEWWKALIDNALVAPVYLFMVYLVCTILQEMTSSSTTTTSFVAAMAGDSGSMAIILQFIVLIGLMWAALVISGKVCASATTGAMNFASNSLKGIGKATGGAVVGGTLAGTAVAGRQIGGSVGKALSKSTTMQRLSQTEGDGIWNRTKRSFGKGAMLGGDQMAKRSWDVRNLPVAGSALTDSLKTYAGIDASFDQKRGREVGGFTGESKKLDEWVDAGKVKRAQLYGGETKAGAEKMAEEYKKKAATATDDKEKKRYEAIAREIMKPIVEKEQKEKTEERAEFKEAVLLAQEEIKEKARDPKTTKTQALTEVIKDYTTKGKDATLEKEQEFYKDLVKELEKEKLVIKKEALQTAQEEVEEKEKAGIMKKQALLDVIAKYQTRDVKTLTPEENESLSTAQEEVRVQEKAGTTKKIALEGVIADYENKADDKASTSEERVLHQDLARELGKELEKETDRIKKTGRKDRTEDYEKILADSGHAEFKNKIKELTAEDITILKTTTIAREVVANKLDARLVGIFAKRKDATTQQLQDIQGFLKKKTGDATTTDKIAEGALRRINKILDFEEKK